MTFEAPGRQIWQVWHFRVNIKKLLQVRCWGEVISIARAPGVGRERWALWLGSEFMLNNLFIEGWYSFARWHHSVTALRFRSAAELVALVSKKLRLGWRERRVPRFWVESTNLSQPMDAHAVLRASLAYVSLCFLLLFFYFKNSLVK